MNFLNSRLRKLEERVRGSCPECSGSAGIVVLYEETEDLASLERCSKCGRPLTIIRVVRDG